MYRKLLNGKMIIVITVLLALIMAAGVAEEERTDASGQWKYALEDGGATITGYVVAPSGDLIIPGEMDGYPVTVIGDRTFCECRNLTSVTIPDGVTSIGARAFMFCSSLTSVIIPDDVTSIGGEAFRGCISLTSATIPDSITSIGDGAFYDCSGLTSVTIPDSITSIGDWVFLGCSGLTSVTIPDSITSIGDRAFSGCSGLTGVTIPASVTNMGTNPFAGCTSLESIHVAAGNPGYTAIGGVLFDEQQKILVSYPGAREGAYTIPDGIPRIGAQAFYKCYDLTDVTIPESVTSIGDSAFYACNSLTSVIIPESVTNIGESTFYDCGGLTSVTIPDSITDIGESAFEECTGLSSVVIPASVTYIGEDAFSGCEGLTLTVTKGSYAAQYAKDNRIPYVFIGDADAAKAETEEITVGTAEELLAALGSNRRILLKEGIYNLTAAEEGFAGNPNVYFEECYDGSALFLDEVHNLTVQGAGVTQSEIVVEPRYAFVMNFLNCSNVSLVNLRVGHTESTVSECESGVLYFEGTTGIQIDSTQMYGCGTVGLSLSRAANVKATGSTIFRCTYSIMEIYDSSDILFEDCVFEDNIGEVIAEAISNFTIDSCSFLRNTDAYNLFTLAEPENVIVKNTEFIDNEAKSLINQKYGDVKFDASNRFENNTFDETR